MEGWYKGMKLPIKFGSIYINYDVGADIATVLRLVADNIADGKIRFTGIEVNEEEEQTYWVKDCGDYELKVLLPFDGKKDFVLDISKRVAICFYIRFKKQISQTT